MPWFGYHFQTAHPLLCHDLHSGAWPVSVRPGRRKNEKVAGRRVREMILVCIWKSAFPSPFQNPGCSCIPNFHSA